MGGGGGGDDGEMGVGGGGVARSYLNPPLPKNMANSHNTLAVFTLRW